MRISPRQIGILIILSLVGLQIVPVHRTNPPSRVEESIYVIEAVPAKVRGIIDRSCRDCHSNQTRWPWYAYVAPASWVVANDVSQARQQTQLLGMGSLLSEEENARIRRDLQQSS